MVANPKYLTKVELLLSSAAGPGASVTYETQFLSTSSFNDYEAVPPTPLPIAEGAVSAFCPVTTRNPYVGDYAAFGIILSDPVNCILGENQRLVVLPGLSEHEIFRDEFTASGTPLLAGHVPILGGVWRYFDQDPTVTPNITGNAVNFGTSNVDSVDIGADYAIPATPDAGTLSVKLVLKASALNSNAEYSLFTFRSISDFNYGAFQLDFGNNHIGLGNDIDDVDTVFNFAALLGTDIQVEMRWDIDGELRTLYINGVAVLSHISVPLTEPLLNMDVVAQGFTTLRMDDLVVTQGGPGAEEVATQLYYFEGEVQSPASSGNIVITGPGAKDGVVMTTSVSGNTYDRTANAQIVLDLSILNLNAVRVECRYLPQVGQRKYGPLAGGDETGTTVRSQYGTIRAVFGGGDDPEVTVQAPMNDIVDLVYPQDAPLPLAAFDVAYEINGAYLRYGVNDGPWTQKPLDQGTAFKLNQLSLTAWVSAVRFEADDTYFEGPYTLSEIRVMDGAPAPQDLGWYGRSQAGAYSSWNAINPTGSVDGAYPASSLAARITNYTLTGEVVWSDRWYPTEGTTGRPVVTSPMGPNPEDFGSGNVNWPRGVDVDGGSMAGSGYGELTLTATVGGVRVPGYLWVVWAQGPQSYATISWGWSIGEPPPYPEV